MILSQYWFWKYFIYSFFSIFFKIHPKWHIKTKYGTNKKTVVGHLHDTQTISSCLNRQVLATMWAKTFAVRSSYWKLVATQHNAKIVNCTITNLDGFMLSVANNLLHRTHCVHKLCSCRKWDRFYVVWFIFSFNLCSFIHGFWGWEHVTQSVQVGIYLIWLLQPGDR